MNKRKRKREREIMIMIEIQWVKRAAISKVANNITKIEWTPENILLQKLTTSYE